MDALFNQVLASVIVGLLSWTGGQLISRWTKRNAATTTAPTQPQPRPQGPVAAYAPPPTARGTAATSSGPAQVNIGQVMIHIAILQFAVNIVGLIIGLVVGFMGAVVGGPSDTVLGVIELLILLFGTLVAIVLFCLFGLRVPKSIRWAHLRYVAIGTIPLTLLVNAIGLQKAPTLLTIIGATIQTFVAMGLGGVCAMLLAPKPSQAMSVPVPAGAYYSPSGPYNQYGQQAQAAPGPRAPDGPPSGAPGWPSPPPSYPPYPHAAPPGHAPTPTSYGHASVHEATGSQNPPASGGPPPEAHQPGWPGQAPNIPMQPPRDG